MASPSLATEVPVDLDALDQSLQMPDVEFNQNMPDPMIMEHISVMDMNNEPQEGSEASPYVQATEEQEPRQSSTTPEVENLREMLTKEVERTQQGSPNLPNIPGFSIGKTTSWNTAVDGLGSEGATGYSLRQNQEPDEQENFSDDPDIDIDSQVAKADTVIQAKRRKGKATFEDELEFTRLVQRRDNAHKRAQMQRQCQRYEDLEDFGSDEEELFVSRLPGSESSDESVLESPPMKKKKKPNSKTKAKPKAKPNGQATAMSGKKGARTKTSTKKQVAQQRQQDNLTNLQAGGLHTNIFRDIKQNQALPDQPTFQSTKRDKALREMLASIPDDKKSIARIDKKQMLDSLKHFTPNGSCRSDGNGGWKVTGLESSLSNYQMLGVAWMRQREVEGEGEGSVPGGLVADAMGLGKTVMCIANIVNGKAKYRYKAPDECEATLIVVPGSLVSQWEGELHRHAKVAKSRKDSGIKRIELHCSKRRVASPYSPMDKVMAEMKKCDVIITTYAELSRRYPKYNPPPELQTAAEREEWWEKRCDDTFGPLHRLKFHRVILDEATAIKNHLSQTSMACRAIRARFRWAVTGTPAQNRSSEFFPYFKFLRFRNTGTFKIFKHNFCNVDENGKERLHHVLRSFMLRRSHGDELLGSKLLNLPAPTEKTIPVYLTDIEQEIYNVVHRRFVARINGISQLGQMQKCYSHIFTLLTRLRQLVCHPLLIHDTIRDLLEPEDFEALKEITNRPSEQFKEQSFLLAHMRKMLLNSKDLVVLESDVSPNIASQYQENNGGPFAQKDNTKAYLASIELKQVAPEPETPCPICQIPEPKQPNAMKCGHVYCANCMLQTCFNDPTHRGRCIIDQMPFEVVDLPRRKRAKRLLEESDESETEEDAGGEQKKKKKKSAKHIVEKWVDAKGNIVPSSKTTLVKAQLLEWKAAKPEVKIIIYTQFLTMVRILANMCKMEGWKAVQLHGGISMKRRDENLKEFAEDAEVTILISTIQSGGLGLNLTMASRVLLLDLWWNTAVEQQAFCRTYRRGQEQSTVLTRLAARNTIDDHILDLQQRKDEELQAIMSGDGYQKLTPKQLMGLFGAVKTDENGCDFIVVEDGPQGKQQRPHGADADDPEGDNQ